MTFKGNTKRLLLNVKNCKAIYDPNDVNSTNRSYLTREWRRIARDLGVKVGDCKRKWIDLIARMKKELQKYPREDRICARHGLRGTTCDCNESRWIWYKDMLIFADYLEMDEDRGDQLPRLMMNMRVDY